MGLRNWAILKDLTTSPSNFHTVPNYTDLSWLTF